MLFSSLVFLFAFLPITWGLSRILPRPAQNWLLLAASLLFYAWGEPKNIILMLLSVSINWLFGLALTRFESKKRIIAVLAVLFNLGLLGFFKYTNFALSGINAVFGTSFAAGVALPIGISFYTFQALSYVLDLYRGEISVQKNWAKLALYISFFPQLIAGPIVQYADIEKQLENRNITPATTAYGIKRFIYGLAKKVILANSFAAVVDRLFGIGAQNLSTPLSWAAVILYALQIYYDFSGYSDMAIGLGSMFGFTFKENFNYPYIARSCTEFWRRWHISLSTWFKDYLYIPLGGNRKSKLRTYINLGIVFFCTGLWHGASLQFIVWGLYYGALLIIERIFLKKHLDKLPVVNHIYTLLSVLIGWVFFRASGLREAFTMLRNMFVPFAGSPAYPAARFLDARIIILAVIGILLCGILQNFVPRLRTTLYETDKMHPAQLFIQIVLLLFCIMLLISGTYNPFIYYRF